MNNENQRVIIKCPLCGEKGLNVVSDNGKQLMQCIHCGYSSSDDYLGTIADNEAFKKIDKGLQKFAKEKNGQVWIPSVLSLEAGMYYPLDVKGELQWAFSPLVLIPEEEQKNYPIEGQEGKFYDKKYDIENQLVFKQFGNGLEQINKTLERLKEQHNQKVSREKSVQVKELKLPKLKKIK
jgi:Zn ribbon nucleic-acid-binding protein